MKDLSLIDRLPELRQAGVSALKIEGRLKNAAWVGRAVSLFKRALIEKEADKDNLREEAEQLGLYTGRTLTSAYLDARRDDLTARAEGRKSQSDFIEEGSAAETSDDIAGSSLLPTNLRSAPGEGQGEGSDAFPAEEESTYDLQLMIEPKGIACSCVCGTREEKWTIPKTVIRRPHKAVAIATLFDQLDQGTLEEFQLGRCETNDPEFLLTPRAANALVDRITKTIRLAQKSPDEMVRIDLPPKVSGLLSSGEASESNRLCLGKKPDRARLDAKDVPAFLRKKGTGPLLPKGIIVEGLAANTLGRIRAMCENVELIAALPQVFFEDNIPQIKKLIAECADQGVTVEVNSWGGWRTGKSGRRENAIWPWPAGAKFPGRKIPCRKRHQLRHAFARGRPPSIGRTRRPLRSALLAGRVRPPAAYNHSRRSPRKVFGPNINRSPGH